MKTPPPKPANKLKYLKAIEAYASKSDELVSPSAAFKEHVEAIWDLKDLSENGAISDVDKAATDVVGERIKQCELELERLQNAGLYALVVDGREEGLTRSPAEHKDDARNNLTVYFAATNIKLDPLAESHVMRILTAVFGA